MPNQVAEEIKTKRSDILISIAETNKEAYEKTFSGERIKVLIEEYDKEDGVCFAKGHTERYVLCRWEESEDFCKKHINEIVEITGA